MSGLGYEHAEQINAMKVNKEAIALDWIGSTLHTPPNRYTRKILVGGSNSSYECPRIFFLLPIDTSSQSTKVSDIKNKKVDVKRSCLAKHD